MIPYSRADSFHEDQVWQSPRGYFWKVEYVANGQATLRQGYDGNGRRARRQRDAVMNWILCADPLYSINAYRQTKT